jgi:hypothetical protein
LADGVKCNLALIEVTAATRTVMATSRTNPKPASTKAFRRASGSGRRPVG